MFNVRIIMFLLLLTMTGCTSMRQWFHNDFKVGPNYRHPEIRVAQTWIEAENQNVVLQSEEQMEWWQLFNDPVLVDLVGAAYQQNLPLRAAGLRIQQARTLRDISELNLLPQSQESFGRFTRNQISLNQEGLFPGIIRNTDNWATGFDLSWELDVWGRLRRQVEASDAALNAEEWNYNDILVTLIGDVAATYVELRSFDERISLAEENVRVQTGSLDIAQARFDNEVASELDVQQATTNVSDTQALIPALREGRRIALDRLAVLLGMTPDELEPVLSARGEIPETPGQIELGIPAELIRRRPDIRDAEQRVAVQSAEIGIAEADLYPQFGIAGEIGWNSAELGDLFSGDSNAGFITPGFRWKILNYGRLVRNVEVQELQYRESIADYQNTVLLAFSEVEDAIAQFIRSKERAALLRNSVNAAARAVELARLQYQEGTIDFGQVFVLEAVLVQRQDALVTAEASIAIGLIRVYKALGGGWQMRCNVPYTGHYALAKIDEPGDANASEELSLPKEATTLELLPMPVLNQPQD